MVEIQARFCLLIGQLIGYAFSQGFSLTFGDAWCKAGHMADSLHYQRLAVDFNLFVDGVWIKTDNAAWHTLGNYWKSLDTLARWGGEISGLVDLNHFSMVPTATDERI
jgi:hypothetical protein